MFLRPLAVAAALAVAPHAACAHEFKAGDLEIIHPYAFETAPTAMAGGGFITQIINHGTEPDRLIGVRSGYPKTEIHESVEKDGVHTMQPVDGIDIPAGGSVELKPGGFHIMFMGLNGKAFVRGATVPTTLIFEKAGEVAVELDVEDRKAAGAMEGMDHSSMETNP